MDWLWLFWILPCTFFTYILFCLARSWRLDRAFVWEEPRDFLIFTIPTNGRNPETVRKTLANIEEICSELKYIRYRIDVVIEEGDSNNYDSNASYKIKTLVVPKKYETNAIYKARALQYATELRRANGENRENVWLYHLDDESMVTRQCLSAIAHHMNGGEELIAHGLIIFPINYTRSSLLARIAQSIRIVGCHDSKFTTDAGIALQLHGNNFLTRADVEDRVGWNHGKSLTEDAFFGFKAQEAGYKIGWHYGVIEEQPVLNLKDHAGQRIRWFRGGWQNVKQIKGKFKFLLAIRLIIWFVGFPAGIIAFVSVLLPQTIPLTARILLLPGTLTWIASYQIGLLHNAKLLSKKSRIGHHLLTLLITPFLGLIETAPAFFFYLFRYKGFYVVRKDLVREEKPGEFAFYLDTPSLVMISLTVFYWVFVMFSLLILGW